jgi:hypothetical protein
MEATCSSETSVDFQRTALHYILEDRTLQNHLCENLKSYTVFTFIEWLALLLRFREVPGSNLGL